MFGDRARKLHYLDKNGKRTTDIFQARLMTSGRKRTTKVRSFYYCFAVCPYPGCWLEFYPEHRCKYRLTLPKI